MLFGQIFASTRGGAEGVLERMSMDFGRGGRRGETSRRPSFLGGADKPSGKGGKPLVLERLIKMVATGSGRLQGVEGRMVSITLAGLKMEALEWGSEASGRKMVDAPRNAATFVRCRFEETPQGLLSIGMRVLHLEGGQGTLSMRVAISGHDASAIERLMPPRPQ